MLDGKNSCHVEVPRESSLLINLIINYESFWMRSIDRGTLKIVKADPHTLITHTRYASALVCLTNMNIS